MATETLPTVPLWLTDVDPKTIGVDDQVRADATPDDELVASVQSMGVLQPPTVFFDTEREQFIVVIGHRRVGAAIAAGLDSIQVLVRDEAEARDALRLEKQLVENERRQGLTPADIARGYKDLAMFGLRPEDIAAAVSETPDRVRAGIRAAQSEKTASILESRPTIDLEQAAVLSEFDEHPKVQFELATTAESNPSNFDYKVRSARDKIAKDERTAELKEQIKSKKIKLAKTDAYGSLDRGTMNISSLVNEEGKKLTARNHASCPGHSAYVRGYRAEDLEIAYACIGYEEHGHRFANGGARELTDEEKQERAEREAHQAAVLANRAARRQWIHDLLPGKINQLPGVYDYMAIALLRLGGGDHRVPSVTLPLLDIAAPTDAYEARKAMDDLVASKQVAPFRLMLATSLGIHEKALENGDPARMIVRHFTQIQKWGYTLSEIDQTALAASQERLDEAERQAKTEAAETETEEDA